MRPSNRTRILDAAVRLIEQAGMTAVTFDAVAAEAGLTRGGLTYHFPSREALLLGLHQHMAEAWEADMEQAAGGRADTLSPAARHAAYARVSSEGATRAMLLVMVESAADPAHAAPWREANERWAPPPPEDDVDDAQVLDRYVLRLASDGLWMLSAMPDSPLSPALRRRIAEHLADLLARPATAARTRGR